MGLPSGHRVRRVLMEPERVARTLARMAHELVERHPSLDGVVLVGVRTRGVPTWLGSRKTSASRYKTTAPAM